MLVLSRAIDETVIIDGHIEVTVLDVRGDKVRLGITAPREMPIHRGEVQQRINDGVTDGSDSNPSGSHTNKWERQPDGSFAPRRVKRDDVSTDGDGA